VDIKKLILTILMLFLLNFSVPLGSQVLNGREKNIIAFVITPDDNDNVSNLLKEKDKYTLSTVVSLYLQISLTDRCYNYFNTS